jgi:hypothetical protein
MTRRKFAFYTYGTDIDAVAERVESLGALFVSSTSSNPQPKLLDRSELTPGSQVLITPRECVVTLAPRNPSGKGWWVLDEGSDPVVEFSISRITDSTLHSGRFYYVPQDATPRPWSSWRSPRPCSILRRSCSLGRGNGQGVRRGARADRRRRRRCVMGVCGSPSRHE